MNAIEHSWRELVKAIKEAHELHMERAPPEKVAEPLRRAHEILDSISDEMRIHGLREPGGGLPTLAEMQAELEAVEKFVAPTRH